MPTWKPASTVFLGGTQQISGLKGKRVRLTTRLATMPATIANVSARINLRTSTEAKIVIERAASLMGTTISSFMLQNAYEAARRIVSENDTLLLTQRDFDAFTASMQKPAKPKAALRKLMARS